MYAGSQQKEKLGDTPTKSKEAVIIAADQLLANGHKQEAGDLDSLEAGRGEAFDLAYRFFHFPPNCRHLLPV